MNIFAIICLVLYVVMIIITLVVRQKLLRDMETSISAEITAGELVENIFNKFSDEKDVKSELIEQTETLVNIDEQELEDEDLYDEDEEDDEDEDESNTSERKSYDYNKKKREFKFENSDEGESFNLSELVEKNKEKDKKTDDDEEYLGTEKIDGTFKYGLDKKEGTVYMTGDIYDSNSYTGIAIASYFTYKYLLNSVKPIRYRLMSLLLLVPKLIVQIGWIFPVSYFFGDMSRFMEELQILFIVVILCLLLSLLDLLYSNYLKDYTMSELIEDGIIKENDIEGFSATMTSVALSDLSKNFAILKWLIGKLGYKI